MALTDLGYYLTVRGKKIKGGDGTGGEITVEDWGASFSSVAIEGLSGSFESPSTGAKKLYSNADQITVVGTVTAGQKIKATGGTPVHYKYTYEVKLTGPVNETLREFKTPSTDQTGPIMHGELATWDDINALNPDGTRKYPVGAYDIVLTVNAEDGGVNGTATATINIFRVILEKSSTGFIPKGGSEDNTVSITARSDQGPEGKFKFTLYDVSSEPGYCMNAPQTLPVSGEDSAAWKDLQFPSQDGFTVSGGNQDVAEITDEDSTDASVTVKAFDYGAYGKIKVEFIPKDTTQSFTGTEEESGEEFISIPVDTNNNHIADSAAQNIGGDGSFAASDDLENVGQVVVNGQPKMGDGFSRYEEYRGFMINGTFNRLDPNNNKDVFVFDWNALTGQGDLGTGDLANLGVTVHLINTPAAKDNEYKVGTGAMNFNANTAHNGAQHGIFVVENNTLGDAVLGYTPRRLNSSGTSVAINVNRIFQIFGDQAVAYGKMTVSHELGHACNLDHHSGTTTRACIMWNGLWINDPIYHNYCTSNPGDMHLYWLH